jgi:hypothetical protein
MDHTKLTLKEVILAQLARGVDVQPSHPGSSSPRGHEFVFLLLKKNLMWGFPPPLSITIMESNSIYLHYIENLKC